MAHWSGGGAFKSMGMPLPGFWQEQSAASTWGRKQRGERVQSAETKQEGYHTAYQHALRAANLSSGARTLTLPMTQTG